MIDIIVIGAGVAGCAIARELSRKKADILVVEREEDVCCGTSKANSAIVHAGYDATHGSLMAKLNVEGSRMMEQLSRDLDFHYRRNGSLVIMLSEEDRPNLMKLYNNGIANGVEGLRIVEREELVQMEPNISDEAVAALYAPTGDLSTLLGWAVVVFVLITYYKIKANGLGGYLKGYLSPIPVMAPMNVISEIATPVSMAFRHFGNIASGSVISALIYAALAAGSNALLGWLPGVLGDVLGAIPILQAGIPAILGLYFDLFTAVIQAYIFSMLTMMYIAAAAE